MSDKFLFSQSCVKDFENEITCPARWKAQWVDGIIPFEESLHMKKGNYFEYLVIGANAKDGAIPTIPLLKNGEKSSDHKRIEEQATLCKRLLFDETHPDWLGFTLVSVQDKIAYGDRQGTLDVVAKDKNGDIWVLDLKLTGDLSSRRTPYSWGNPWETLDLIQQTHYEFLLEKKLGTRPKVGLLVADYSPKKRIEFGELEILDSRRVAYHERFAAAGEAYELYEKNGWTKIGHKNECIRCPLHCDKRVEAYAGKDITRR